MPPRARCQALRQRRVEDRATWPVGRCELRLGALAAETEITGPIAAKLFVSSATDDADLFVVVRVFNPELKEVTFQGHTDPHTTIAQGWLRASHRKLDPQAQPASTGRTTRTMRYRTLTPGRIYELEIEVWPTCIVIPKGYRMVVSVRGKDYEYPGGVGGPRRENARHLYRRRPVPS